MASTSSKVCCTSTCSLISCSSRIISSSTCRRPAVSRITTLCPFFCAKAIASLAISIGNAHGEYRDTPHLDIRRLEDIHAATSVPLVLHGGSGIPHDQLRESVRLGMSKFNIATEYFQACCQSVAGAMEAGAKGGLPGLMEEAAQGAVDFVRGKMRLLNPNGFSL